MAYSIRLTSARDKRMTKTMASGNSSPDWPNPQVSSTALSDHLVCYHCGEDVPHGSTFSAVIANTPQPMCCPGCVAVAQMISAGGLEGFYDQRTAYNARPTELERDQSERLRIYDEPVLAQTFSHELEDGKRAVNILVSGITCAACTWLIEKVVGKLDGVDFAQVSFQESRLQVTLNLENCRISDVFIALQQLGYTPKPYESNIRQEAEKSQQREALKRLAVAGLGMMQVGMFAVALHAGDLQGMAAEYQSLLRWVSLPVTTFVVFYSARGFFTTAWRHLKHGALVMDLPVAIAIGLALLASIWATITQTGQVYFDSIVMFTFFLLLGRYLEQRARLRYLHNWNDTEASLPAAVTKLSEAGWKLVPRLEITSGDTILIKPGEVVSADATVKRGSGELREDAFSGESLPRFVQPGDTIYAGTINLHHELEANVTCDQHESRLALLLRSVQTAQSGRPKIAALADRIAAWFVAGVLLAATAVFVTWLTIDPERALWVTLSVLVISCPCALALATPAALTAAANALRDRGVIVNAPDALAALPNITHMVFDKTGTLTQGNLSLEDTIPLGVANKADILNLAAALQQHSTHPIASAFKTLTPDASVREVATVQGAGMEAKVNGVTVRIGSEAFCREIAPSLCDHPSSPLYWVALCKQNQPLAWLGFSDALRPESKQVVANARAKGIQVEMLT
ncbi:MAG: heavy metal translocating P-type ATPase, partial [Halioglobus sp.]